MRKEFNIKKAQAGAKVVTRDGRQKVSFKVSKAIKKETNKL